MIVCGCDLMLNFHFENKLSDLNWLHISAFYFLVISGSTADGARSIEVLRNDETSVNEK